MTEEDLNTKYICEKTLLDKNDELVPIILNLIQESYKSGLCQTEFDNTMELLEENKQLKEDFKKEQYLVDKLTRQISDEYKNTNFQCRKVKQLEERIQKAIDYIDKNKRITSSHYNGKEYEYINFELVCLPNELLDILQGKEDK